MRSKDVRSRDVRSLEQGVKIGNEIAGRTWHGNGRAAAQMICVKKCSRPVVSANPRELGNLRKNGIHSGLKFGTPNVGIISVTGLENHRRAAGTAALQIHLALRPDVDQTGKIA